MRYQAVPGHCVAGRHRCRAPVAVGITRQVPAVALAVQPAVVLDPADRVGDVLAAEVALDPPRDLWTRPPPIGIGHLTEMRPRPSFCASLTPPSSLCPSLRTMTASVCGPAGAQSRVGMVNVARSRSSVGCRRGGQDVLAEVDAVEPRLEHSGAAPAVAHRQSSRRGGARVGPAVPDVALMEAVVVGGEHRLPGRGRSGAIRRCLVGDLPARVVEAGCASGDSGAYCHWPSRGPAA